MDKFSLMTHKRKVSGSKPQYDLSFSQWMSWESNPIQAPTEKLKLNTNTVHMFGKSAPWSIEPQTYVPFVGECFSTSPPEPLT